MQCYGSTSPLRDSKSSPSVTSSKGVDDCKLSQHEKSHLLSNFVLRSHPNSHNEIDSTYYSESNCYHDNNCSIMNELSKSNEGNNNSCFLKEERLNLLPFRMNFILRNSCLIFTILSFICIIIQTFMYCYNQQYHFTNISKIVFDDKVSNLSFANNTYFVNKNNTNKHLDVLNVTNLEQNNSSSNISQSKQVITNSLSLTKTYQNSSISNAFHNEEIDGEHESHEFIHSINILKDSINQIVKSSAGLYPKQYTCYDFINHHRFDQQSNQTFTKNKIKSSIFDHRKINLSIHVISRYANMMNLTIRIGQMWKQENDFHYYQGLEFVFFGSEEHDSYKIACAFIDSNYVQRPNKSQNINRHERNDNDFPYSATSTFISLSSLPFNTYSNIIHTPNITTVTQASRFNAKTNLNSSSYSVWNEDTTIQYNHSVYQTSSTNTMNKKNIFHDQYMCMQYYPNNNYIFNQYNANNSKIRREATFIITSIFDDDDENDNYEHIVEPVSSLQQQRRRWNRVNGFDQLYDVFMNCTMIDIFPSLSILSQSKSTPKTCNLDIQQTALLHSAGLTIEYGSDFTWSDFTTPKSIHNHKNQQYNHHTNNLYDFNSYELGACGERLFYCQDDRNWNSVMTTFQSNTCHDLEVLKPLSDGTPISKYNYKGELVKPMLDACENAPSLWINETKSYTNHPYNYVACGKQPCLQDGTKCTYSGKPFYCVNIPQLEVCKLGYVNTCQICCNVDSIWYDSTEIGERRCGVEVCWEEGHETTCPEPTLEFDVFKVLPYLLLGISILLIIIF